MGGDNRNRSTIIIVYPVYILCSTIHFFNVAICIQIYGHTMVNVCVRGWVSLCYRDSSIGVIDVFGFDVRMYVRGFLV